MTSSNVGKKRSRKWRSSSLLTYRNVFKSLECIWIFYRVDCFGCCLKCGSLGHDVMGNCKTMHQSQLDDTWTIVEHELNWWSNRFELDSVTFYGPWAFENRVSWEVWKYVPRNPVTMQGQQLQQRNTFKLPASDQNDSNSSCVLENVADFTRKLNIEVIESVRWAEMRLCGHILDGFDSWNLENVQIRSQ